MTSCESNGACEIIRVSRITENTSPVLSFLFLLSHGNKWKPVQGSEQHLSLRRVSIWKIIIYRFYSYNDCRFAKFRRDSSWPQQIRAHIAPMAGNVQEKPCFSQKPLLRRWKIKNYRCWNCINNGNWFGKSTVRGYHAPCFDGMVHFSAFLFWYTGTMRTGRTE